MSTALPNKSTKTRRETAVQGTNDSSIVSKWSTATCGYFDDSFLQHFISKHSRRAPLIHRGYYIRAKAFERIIKNFLKAFHHHKKQIISLGTGFDSTYFRLKGAHMMTDINFYEVDFPELVKRKRLLIENSPELRYFIQKTDTQPSSPYIELSCTDYQLLGVDLTQLNTLEAALKMCGINFECPTLLLSECVMTYMTRRCSTDLVKWAAETFDQGVFVMYEQMHPNDAFGLFMQAHFHSIGSPLKCINAFPSLQSQKDRFLNVGWAHCEAVDMNTFYYGCLEETERKRMENLEIFDEYEELNLKYSHYFILAASTVDLGQSLITDNNHTLPESICHEEVQEVVTISRIPQVDESVRRFGHASSLVMDRYAITSGGFGETDGRHQRLAELTITDLNTLKSHHVSCSSPDMQIPRMHHSSVTLSSGETLLIAGRQSPFFMCNQMLEVTLQITHHSDVQMESQSSIQNPSSNGSFPSVPKENCSVTLSSEGNHEVYAAEEQNSQSKTSFDKSKQSFKSTTNHKTNALTEEGDAERVPPHPCLESHDLSQTLPFKLGTLSIRFIEQKGKVPRERWRHSTVVVNHKGEEKVFLFGGKNKTGEVLQDTFIFDPLTKSWIECTCTGALPGPRHSHCLTYWHGKVILTGGLDRSNIPTDIVFCLDLSTMVWEKMDFSGPLHARYSHTAHLHDNMLLLVGGVNTNEKPPGLAVISLTSGISQEFAFPAQDKENLLMLHRHTSVMQSEVTHKTIPQLVLFGGGGNCFSFGTHLNRTPVLVDVEAACSSLHNTLAS